MLHQPGKPSAGKKVRKVNRSRFINERGEQILDYSKFSPNGKRVVVSDRAVESLAKDMERRTNEAIRKIARSTGF